MERRVKKGIRRFRTALVQLSLTSPVSFKIHSRQKKLETHCEPGNGGNGSQKQATKLGFTEVSSSSPTAACCDSLGTTVRTLRRAEIARKKK
ncbi:hypothetical protein ABVT39_022066 [Epinephelus coioides]